jgi:hypothetical protein
MLQLSQKKWLVRWQVCKKLYDLPYASQRIENFATSMLYSAVGMEESMNQKTIQSSGDDEGLLHQQSIEQVYYFVSAETSMNGIVCSVFT